MGRIAFVFAGQGAQSVGMGKDLYHYSDGVKALFDMAESKKQGITALLFDGPKEQLDITINTQPALFLADLACAEILNENNIKADGVAGFSLGEIPAACYAGLMKKQQAFDFVCHRAKAMQACAEQYKGVMFAVLKLAVSDVETLCATLEQAYPVNYNGPGQTVVACAENTAEKLQSCVAEAGGKAVRLAVSGAFHSPFMDDASENIAKYLEKEHLENPCLPLYSNMTAQIYDNHPKNLLAQQINHPVLWQKTVETMINDGFSTFVEVGPGKTLSGLIKKISANVLLYNVSDMQSLENTVRELSYA